MTASKKKLAAPRVVLAAGGTGGHVFPALAVASYLRRLRPEARFLFIGGDRMEAQIVPAAGLPFRAISVHGLAGRGAAAWGRRLRASAELLLGLPLLQSRSLLRSFRPHVVIGTGGYVSGPVLLMARWMRIPSLAAEGNRTPGLTTRAAAKLVDVMALACPEQAAFFAPRVRRSARVAVTGLPVRPQILEVGREEAAASLHLDPSLTTLVALGGSLGSERVNEALVGALRQLGREEERLRQVQVLHVTGRRGAIALTPAEVEELAPRYRAVPFLGRTYPEALAAADLVISRGGASTLAELTARGLPAIVVPWAEASTGEQALNAAPLAKAGAAVVIPDAELTASRLAEALGRLLWEAETRAAMARAMRVLGRPKAGEMVAELALLLAEGRRPPPGVTSPS